MPTTDRELASASLDALHAANVRFAILHGADRLGSGPISDIDIVVDLEPCLVLEATSSEWDARGLAPVVIWPYDIGGTATIFLAKPDATEGVQLDLLFDPRGVGKYGVKSGELMNLATVGEPFPVLSAEATLVYQWRKRRMKRDRKGLEYVADAAQSLDPVALIQASIRATGSNDAAEQMLGRDFSIERDLIDHPLQRSERLVRRMVEPVGFWAHVSDLGIASELADRFRRFLTIADSGSVPSAVMQPLWWASEVMPVRLRPGTYVSAGPVPFLPPDHVVGTLSPDDTARLVVASMAKRVRDRCAS